ncbi:MAG: GTP pyrophosphokinase family protein [Lachnospiraceae bacterium]
MGEIAVEVKDGGLQSLKEGMEQESFQRIYEGAVQKAMEITREEAGRLETECSREIISGLSGRVKTPESVQRKLQKKRCAVNLETAVMRLNDIAGMRATCFFLDDVYELAERLKENRNLHFIKEKNYIEKPKTSGYKSLHLIAEVPVEVADTEQWVRIEIQLRTLAMDFWARLDHRLCYKKDLKAAKAVQKDLKEYAEIISKVDVHMLTLRKRIDAL